MNRILDPFVSLPRFRRRDGLFLLALLILTAAFHPSIVFQGQIPLDEDSLLFFYPLRALHHDASIGFWDPYLFCGFPRDVNPQSQILYPANLFLLFLPTAAGYPLLLFGHLFLGGFFVYLGLRGCKIRPEAAFLGAAAFLLSTFWRCKITNLGLLEGITWVPPAMFLYLYALEKRRWILGLLSALMVSLVILAGVPHTVVYTFLLLFLITLAYLVFRSQSPAFCLGLFAWVLGFSVLMTMGLWYPAVLYAPQAARGAIGLDSALAGSIGIADIWKVFLGGLNQPEISRCDPWEGTCYFGITALFLIPMGWKAVPNRLRFALLLPIVTAVFFTLGSQGLIYTQLYEWVPGWNSLNMPNRSLLMAAVTLPIFVGMGAEWWLRTAFSRRQAAVLLGLLLAACAGGFVWGLVQVPWAWTGLVHSALTDVFAPRAFSSTQWALFNLCFWLGVTSFVLLPWVLKKIRTEVLVGMLAAILAAQAMQYGPRLFLQTTDSDYFDTPETVRILREALQKKDGRVCSYVPFVDSGSDVRLRYVRPALMHRLPEVFRVREIQGYDPLMPRAYTELVRAWAGQSPATDALRTVRVQRLPQSLLNFLGVRYVVGHPQQEMVYSGSFELAKPDRVVSPLSTPRTIRAVGIRWMAAGTFSVPQGETVASVQVLNGTETVQVFPVRMGQELANYIMEADGRQAAHRPADEYRWFPIPSLSGYTAVRQYWAEFPLAQPSRADGVAVEWRLPEAVLSIREIDVMGAEESPLVLLSAEGELPVYENPQAQEPVYLTRQVVRYEHPDEMIETLKRRNPSAEVPVFFHTRQQVPFDSPPLETRVPEDDPLRFERERSDRMKIQFKSTYDSILVIQENYSTNWTATLDGKKAALLPANHAFMALPVQAGKHTVTLRYFPRAFYIGWSVGGAAWVAAIVFGLLFMRNRIGILNGSANVLPENEIKG